MTSRRVAYHEAGHAVMHILERVPFQFVTITPDEESRGHTLGCPPPRGLQPDCDTGPRVRSRIESLVRIELAGQVAEQILRGRKSWNQGSEHDLGNAVGLLQYLVDVDDNDTLDAYCRLLLLQTRNALRENWGIVEAVAAALLAEETLSAREVRRLAQGAPGRFYGPASRPGRAEPIEHRPPAERPP